MKIAIYGDSFADPNVCNFHLTTNGVNVGWPDLLKQKYEVDVFARGGTSVYYSYDNFKKTHQNYDKVIFLLTDSRRWPYLFEVKNKPNQYNDNLFSFANLAMIHDFLHNPESVKYMDSGLKDKLKALQHYYMFLLDDLESVNVDFSCLMINDIFRIRSDVIMLSGFNFGETHPIQCKPSLATFAYIWLNNWPKYRKQISGNQYLHWAEKRTVCHFSKEVNEVIAKEMAIAIETGKWEPNVPDVIPAEHSDFEYYYHL